MTYSSDLKDLAARSGWTYQMVLPAQRQTRFPSRTIQSQVERIVRDGKQQAADFIRHGSTLEKERQIARLYSERRYTLPETFTCLIPGAVIWGPTGIIVTGQGHILQQSVTYGDERTLRIVLMRDAAQYPPLMVSETCISMRGFGDRTYGHWLLDCMPRLMLVEDPNDYHVVVPTNYGSIHQQCLEMLGMRHIINEPEHSIWAEQLLMLHPNYHTCFVNGDLVRKLADSLIDGISVGERTRRTYVSRRDVRVDRESTIGRRNIINEADLMPILDHYGFDILLPAQLSLPDQIKTFAESEVVMGPNGSGLVNQIFCRPGTIIIDILNPVTWDQEPVRTASVLKNIHWHLWAEDSGEFHDMTVDPVALDELLSTALDEPAYYPEVNRYLANYPGD